MNDAYCVKVGCKQPTIPKRNLCIKHSKEWNKIWDKCTNHIEEKSEVERIQTAWNKFLSGDKEVVQFT